MEIVRRHSLGPQELRNLLRLPAGGAVDDGASGSIRRQVGFQDLMYVGQLAFAAGGHHHEIQVGSLGVAVKHLQIDVQLFPEVAHYLGLDVGLGRSGEAQHRRNGLVPGPLADEAPHVTVVWAEVVSPPGEAVGFVQHPRADFPLGQDPPKGRRCAAVPAR